MKRRIKRRFAKRGFFRKARRSVSSGGLIMPLAAAGLYGAARSYISNWISPLASKIPLGQYADETGMMLANYLAYRFVGNKIPMVKDMAKGGMIVEAAMIGSTLAGNMGVSTSGSSVSSDWE